MSDIEFAPQNYETTPSRVTLAVAVGALTGGISITLFGLIGTAFVYGLEAAYGSWRVNVFVFVAALTVWAIGLVIVGLPLWWVLHRSGYRAWYVAAAAGVVATCLACFALD